MKIYLLWDIFRDSRRELVGATESEDLAEAFSQMKVDGLWRREYTSVVVGQEDATLQQKVKESR